MRNLATLAITFVFPALLAAQTPAPAPVANPVTAASQRRITAMHRNIAQAFDSIPEAKFAYKPTPAQLSIGFIAQHVASDNYLFCDQFGRRSPVCRRRTRPLPTRSRRPGPKTRWSPSSRRRLRFVRRPSGSSRTGSSVTRSP